MFHCSSASTAIASAPAVLWSPPTPTAPAISAQSNGGGGGAAAEISMMNSSNIFIHVHSFKTTGPSFAYVVVVCLLQKTNKSKKKNKG
jgi:hypothetical protein